MSAEQDTRCAELLGWHKGANHAAISPMPGQELPWYWYDADGKQCAPCITDAFANMYPFSPSTNHEHARVLEDAIERRGHEQPYIANLTGLLQTNSNFPGEVSDSDMWAIRRVTPAQIAAAFIATMEQVS